MAGHVPSWHLGQLCFPSTALPLQAWSDIQRDHRSFRHSLAYAQQVTNWGRLRDSMLSGLILALQLVTAFTAWPDPSRLGLSAPALLPSKAGAAQRPTRNTSAVTGSDNQLNFLDLCECEQTTADGTGGLGCDKEGWFVSSFERVGTWAQGSTAFVPLSHAICCRPCLPTEIPSGAGVVKEDDKPLAIISMGCHASSSRGYDQQRCEPGGGSFVTGWSSSMRVSFSYDAYYPVGPVDCCTPAVLLSSGDAWELERCDCMLSSDISCGGQDHHRLLQGYASGRRFGAGQILPVAPAECCRACISDRLHPISACEDRGRCSGHGVCALGMCECSEGWAGADCSLKAGIHGGGLPAWLIALIVMCSSAAFIMLLAVLGAIVRVLNPDGSEDGDSEGEQGMREPLLMALDGDEGSVGSEDTTNCSLSDFGDFESRAPGERREGPLGGGSYVVDSPEEPSPMSTSTPGIPLAAIRLRTLRDSAAEPEAEPEAEAAPAQASQAQAQRRLQDSEERNGEDAAAPAPPAAAGGEIQAAARPEPASVADIVAEDDDDDVMSEDEAQEAVDHAAARRLPDMPSIATPAPDGEKDEDQGKFDVDGMGVVVAGCDCSVCLSRPVQVVVIPCGHACMCRRCSRRIPRCPVCRKEILRRQRLYMGG